MSYPIIQIDAFTNQAFQGNPATVCLLQEPKTETWMQHVAMEMNLSETAFLVKRADKGYDLRWFTPAVEVELCGHATLASAHMLWEEGHLDRSETAAFYTKSGWLYAHQEGDWISMSFPSRAPRIAEPHAQLLEALGITDPPDYIGKNKEDYIIAVATESSLKALGPDFGLLKHIPVRGVIVTAPSDQQPYDFVSRFFAPACGVDEDPVTGSAHCCLAPYWTNRLGKQQLVGYQASKRGGTVKVAVDGERVHLGGQAVMVAKGELLCE